MNGKIEIKKRVNGKYYWVLVASNGQQIATSYNDYENILAINNAIDVIKKYISHPSLEIVKQINQ